MIANKIYNEPYTAIKMNHKIEKTESDLKVTHSLCVNKEWFNIVVTAENKRQCASIRDNRTFFLKNTRFGKDKQTIH